MAVETPPQRRLVLRQVEGYSRAIMTPMSVTAGIIDQRVRALAAEHASAFSSQAPAAHSAAFVMLTISTVLGLTLAEALDSLTGKSGDLDIDGLHIGDPEDGEFVVTIVQGKYATSLDGQKGFPANAIKKLIGTVRVLFDPRIELTANDLLRPKIAEVHGLILDGNLPIVRVLLCNNGKKWEADGQALIDAFSAGDRVVWEHVNHDRIVALLRKRQQVSDTLHLNGNAIVEDFNFRRVLIGRVPVTTIKALFDRHGDVLLERNIRRFLGLGKNRVNMGIHATLLDVNERPNFYFYNNGITAVCSKFRHNALQASDYQVQVENLQIINGGQTCRTIQETLAQNPDHDYGSAFVLLRLYELGSDDDLLVRMITYATNSQNPVDLGDLRANDPIQERIGIELEGLGFKYKRKRDGSAVGPDTITSSVAAEAVMAVWRAKPHAAKFRRRRLFSDLYAEIFTEDLTAAQIILAVLIFRFVENERRRPSDATLVNRFTPYASHFLSMVIGKTLVNSLDMRPNQIDHRNLTELRAAFDNRRAALYAQAVALVRDGLAGLGIDDATPLPRVAATFRRGDLLFQSELSRFATQGIALPGTGADVH